MQKYSSFTGGKKLLNSPSIVKQHHLLIFATLYFCILVSVSFFVRQDHTAVSMRICIYLYNEERDKRELKGWTVFSYNTAFSPPSTG